MGTYAYTHRHKYIQTNRSLLSQLFFVTTNNSNINAKTLNDLLLNY